jgi:Flp pilus assembly protein TadD
VDTPNYSQPYYELGNLLHETGHFEEAADCYREAIAAAPTAALHAQAWYNLGVTRMRQDRLVESRAAYLEAVKLDPLYPEASNNLGSVLYELGNTEEAESAWLAAARLRPGWADPLFNLGILHQKRGDLDRALEYYQAVLVHNPEHAEARMNLGSTLLALGRPAEAFERYRETLDRQPENADLHANMALLRLLQGDFRAGWEEYEWRWRQPKALLRTFHRPDVMTSEIPLWDGAALKGRRILIHAEQGFGDTIQFIRFASLVKNRGGEVILECQPSLHRLLSTARGVGQTVVRDTPLPLFDVHAPLLSLPRILGTTLDSIPADVPYLHANPALTAKFGELIAAAAGGRRTVGLVWAGNPANPNDRNRSLPFALAEELASLPGMAFFSLQKGARAFIPLDEHMTDFAETAAAIANLDLVISVDTAVAHLAGALGRPVWTLLPFAPDWRWLLGREDSPWYPTMRLFRQARRGDWPSVIRNVKLALESHVYDFRCAHSGR